MRTAALAAILLAISGCVVEGGTAGFSVDHMGDTQSDQRQRTIDCQDATVLAYDVSRLDGDLTILVLDGTGAVVFAREFNDPEYAKGGGAALGANEHALFGDIGTWTVAAEWAASSIAFTTELRCGSQ